MVYLHVRLLAGPVPTSSVLSVFAYLDYSTFFVACSTQLQSIILCQRYPYLQYPYLKIVNAFLSILHFLRSHYCLAVPVKQLIVNQLIAT